MYMFTLIEIVLANLNMFCDFCIMHVIIAMCLQTSRIYTESCFTYQFISRMAT